MEWKTLKVLFPGSKHEWAVVERSEAEAALAEAVKQYEAEHEDCIKKAGELADLQAKLAAAEKRANMESDEYALAKLRGWNEEKAARIAALEAERDEARMLCGASERGRKKLEAEVARLKVCARCSVNVCKEMRDGEEDCPLTSSRTDKMAREIRIAEKLGMGLPARPDADTRYNNAVFVIEKPKRKRRRS